MLLLRLTMDSFGICTLRGKIKTDTDTYISLDNIIFFKVTADLAKRNGVS